MTIEELLVTPENEHFEFKEAKNNFHFEDAVKYCCALSNCGGGKLVLGITDRRPRRIVGSNAFDQPERTRKGLIERLHINVDFQIFNYEGKRVLVFDVAGHPLGLPVQANGIAWWRNCDSLVEMPENVRCTIYAETGHDFSGDVCNNATLHDLDEGAIEAFRTNWIEKSSNSRLKNLSVEQLLRDCEAMSDNGITYAALVLFGTRTALGKYLPQSEIIFEYRSSDASGPAQQREEFRIGFFACYNRLWELVNLRNDKQHYQDGLFVFDIPTFNERVVREALLNAVSHRNYQLSGSIFVRQYRNRLVIESPGGLPTGVTLDNILDRQAPRNRRIAEIFALCGMVERSGQGMNLIYELSIKEAKSTPDFSGTDSNFVNITLNGSVLDKKMLLLINKIGNERLESMSTSDFLVINTLFHGQKLAENLHPSIKRLIDMGIIEKTSKSRFILAHMLGHAVLDRNMNKELILTHIKRNGKKGTQLRELQQILPDYSRSQLQVLLRELKKSGLIFSIGKTIAGKWYNSTQ